MYERWVNSRIDLAERLAAGEAGGSFAEAILILSSLLSGIAADLWPGGGIDQRRFVELWVRYSDPTHCGNLISIPLLIDHLESENQFDLADRLRSNNSHAFSPRGLPDPLVVTAEDVDIFEDELLPLVPEIARTVVRRFSYANVFYVHFRSGYVHEYQVGSHGAPVIMTHTRSFVTYSNDIERPHRRINFDIEWLASLVRGISYRAMPEWSRRPLTRPTQWWHEGAA